MRERLALIYGQVNLNPKHFHEEDREQGALDTAIVVVALL